MKKGIKEAFVNTLPIMTGYIFLGIPLGLMMGQKGYPVWYSIAMSIFIYSGALEYAAVPLFAQPFDPLSAFILSVMLSARHLFYGIPMLKKYENTGIVKPFLIFGLTDETFSLLSTLDVPDMVKPKSFYTLVTLFDYAYWNIGTAIGSIFGNIVPFDLTGLDFALTALFIVLMLEQMKTKEGVISGIIGLAVTIAVLFIFGSGNLVIFSMIGIAVLLISGRRVITNE